MFGMEPVTLLATVSTAIAVAMLVRGLFRVDDRVEERRKDAIEAGQELTEAGLGVLAPLLTDYAVGDYSGMRQELKRIVRELRDPEKRAAALKKLFSEQLAARLADPKERLEVERQVAEAKARLAVVAGSSASPAARAAIE